MEVLRLEDISKQIGGLRILNEISLSLQEGERWGIIGPNGSGKTTLLNVISGVMRPSSGKVYLFGKEVSGRPVHAFVHLGLARTFQLNTLFLRMTVLDNTLFALKGTKRYRFRMLRSLDSYDALFTEAKEVLLQWGLWEKRELAVKSLSYGDQRCLELILGLVSNPRVVLLDEPTAGLSAQEIAIFKRVIEAIQSKHTVVIVEHNLDVIFELAQSFIVLDHGEIIAKGDKDSIKADPRVRKVYLGPVT